MEQEKKPKTKAEKKASCLMIVLGLVVVGVVFVKLTDFSVKQPQAPILAESPGLVKFHTPAAAQEKTTTPIIVPGDRFGSDVYLIGIYKSATETITKESVAIILTKDNWRFVELFQKPNRTLDQEIALYKNKQQEEIKISDHVAYLINLDRGYEHCIDPTDTQPGQCFLSKALVFEINNTVFTIAADNNHATEGQLIEMAKNIIGGVFWAKFEHFLSKIPNKEASPATARQARHTTEKYSLLFSYCARPIFSSFNEKSIFLRCSAFQVFRQVAGLSSI